LPKVRLRHALILAGSILLLALAWPVAGSADHVSIKASIVALLKERVGSDTWKVEVSYFVECLGVTRGALYSGDRSLVDEKTGERIYLGGASFASYTSIQLVKAKPDWRRLHPELTISCGEDLGGHGAGPITVVGDAVNIPPLDGGRDDGGGGGGGGSGGGSDGGDPTQPTTSGGCLRPLVGTDGPDTLAGTGGGDVIFGRGGTDAIRGRDGHDCLIGGRGSDTLRGEKGNDRLTGGRGADTLLGGAGLNAYDAGSGNDVVNSVNGRVELVRCGPGNDRATVDRRDRVSGCERVTRVAR
jgi:Ca2+-binding RTX toxin-like protein